MSAAAAPLPGSAAAVPAQMRQGAARPGVEGQARVQAETPWPPAAIGRGAAADAAGVPGDPAAGPPDYPPFSELLGHAAPVSPVQTAGDSDDVAMQPDPTEPAQLLALLDGPWWGVGPAAPQPPAPVPTAHAGSAPGASPSSPPAPIAAPAAMASPAAAQPAQGEGAPGNIEMTEGVTTTAATAMPAGAKPASAVPMRDAPTPLATPLATPPATPLATPLAESPVAGQAVDGNANGDGARGLAIEGPSAAFEALPARPTAVARPPAVALPPLAMPANPAAGFDDGFGERIVWMVDQRLGHAEIRLNPEHLGPIDIRVELDGDVVHAGFHSARPEVLEAIEATLPRLRELLGQHGMQLGQPQQGLRQGGLDAAPGRGGSPGRGDAGSDLADRAPARPASIRPRGLVDMYA